MGHINWVISVCCDKDYIYSGAHDPNIRVWDKKTFKCVKILKDGNVNSLCCDLDYLFMASNDYFTVYTSNAFLIGQIKNNDLRKAIVRTYTLSKSLLDSLRINNHFVEQRGIHWQALQLNPENTFHKQQFRSFQDRAVDMASRIKDRHNMTRDAVSDIKRRLQKEGVLVEKNG